MENMNDLYGQMPTLSRKRSRDEANHHLISANQFGFCGQDFSSYIYRDTLEADRFITHHMEKVRLEVEHRRKRHFRRVIGGIQAKMMNKLKAKEEEIQKVKLLNWTLEDRIKTLCIENQMWRELSQANESKVNALRNNLQQLLAIGQEDESSCCGSSDDVDRRTLEGGNVVDVSRFNGGVNGSCESSRVCRRCGKEEACVVLLPCRHLCLCAVCGVSVHVCPFCNCVPNFSLHVNMSS